MKGPARAGPFCFRRGIPKASHYTLGSSQCAVLKYVIRRLLLIIPTMFFVALITFTLALAAPGSPFDRNPTRPLPQETIDRFNRYYGLDKPIPEQFVIYLGHLVQV